LGPDLLGKRLSAADPKLLLVVTRPGKGLDYGHWRQRRWLPATEAAGRSGLQFHDLRRTAATALVLERIDTKTADPTRAR
jgi:integrase